MLKLATAVEKTKSGPEKCRCTHTCDNLKLLRKLHDSNKIMSGQNTVDVQIAQKTHSLVKLACMQFAAGGCAGIVKMLGSESGTPHHCTTLTFKINYYNRSLQSI